MCYGVDGFLPPSLALPCLAFQVSKAHFTTTMAAATGSKSAAAGGTGGGDGEIDISTLSAEQLQGLLKQVDGVSTPHDSNHIHYPH